MAPRGSRGCWCSRSLFFIPYALLTAELGCGVHRGGRPLYLDAPRIRAVRACINAVFYWFSNPVWIGGALVLLTLEAVDTYFFDISTGGFLWYVVGLIYIWFSVWSAILSFGIGKWIPTLGAWCRMLAARRLHDRRDHLRHLERAQPAGGRRLLADLRALHRARPAALLQLRRLRASERRRRRDGGSAEGRARHGAPCAHSRRS